MLAESPLRIVNGRYEVDWDSFEQQCADPAVKVFLLCNPHNPTGRVWTKEELTRIGNICRQHDVFVISDEIHCEFTMSGHTYTPFASISEDFSKNCAVCLSPSKAFNIAGLQIANIISNDPTTRRLINRAININEICDVNPFGVIALQEAYNNGEPWLLELNRYLEDNYQALHTFFKQRLPHLKVFKLEGTYLVWVDISATGKSSDEITEQLLKEGKVMVNSGTIYGKTAGEGYIRINIACPRIVMMEGLRRIQQVLSL